MKIDHHPFIDKIEKQSNIILSVFGMEDCPIVDGKSDKFELVYINSDYHPSDWDEVIYKTKSDFYLLFKSTGIKGRYNLECYFPSDKLSQVQILLNSMVKKK